eukprot:6503833-Prymnesium_polylepis.1
MGRDAGSRSAPYRRTRRSGTTTVSSKIMLSLIMSYVCACSSMRSARSLSALDERSSRIILCGRDGRRSVSA